jgi:hypothetical protein
MPGFTRGDVDDSRAREIEPLRPDVKAATWESFAQSTCGGQAGRRGAPRGTHAQGSAPGAARAIVRMPSGDSGRPGPPARASPLDIGPWARHPACSCAGPEPDG